MTVLIGRTAAGRESNNHERKKKIRYRRGALAASEANLRHHAGVLSHGEPTFFVRKKVFAMFANNHHDDGHIAVWIPAPPGLQGMLIQSSPETFFRPPYVGVRGWVGIELDSISDVELAAHIHEAWLLIAPKKLRGSGGRFSSR